MSNCLGQGYIDHLLTHDEQYFQCVLNFFEAHVSKTAAVLDVGAGVGCLVNILKNKGYANVTGIEPVKEYVTIGQTRLGLEKNLFAVNDAELKKESFDVVLSFTVAEHVDDVQAFIDFKLKYLKDGGIFYLFAPDYCRPDYFLGIIRAKMKKEKLHLTPFTDGGILRSIVFFIHVWCNTFVRKLLKKPMIIKVRPVSPERSVGGDADAVWCCNYLDIIYCIARSHGIAFEKILDKHALAGKIYRNKN